MSGWLVFNAYVAAERSGSLSVIRVDDDVEDEQVILESSDGADNG